MPPQPPKPAVTAMQFYVQDRREQIQAERPELDAKEVQKAISEEWKAMDTSAKAPYIEKAHTDKQRYEEEAASYVPDPSQPNLSSGKRPRDPRRPKRPKSAYAFFGEATRAELSASMPGLAIDTLSKLIGQEWRKLSEEQKAPYTQLAQQDKERYQMDMATYVPPSGEEEEDEEDFDGDFEAENAYLKRKLEFTRQKIVEQAKEIEELKSELKEAKKAKTERSAPKKATAAAAVAAEAEDEEKADGCKSTGKSGSSRGAGAGSKGEPAPTRDDSHYLRWCQKVLGQKGEKADEEMRTTLETKGEAALVKLLAKRYKEEHSA